MTRRGRRTAGSPPRLRYVIIAVGTVVLVALYAAALAVAWHVFSGGAS